MERQRTGRPSCDGLYALELRDAIASHLPRRGLPLRSASKNRRWTDRLLFFTAVVMGWQVASTLQEAFEQAAEVVTKMYPSLRRVGQGYEGFIKALRRQSSRLLAWVSQALRESVRSVAGPYWKIGRWVVMGVDGTRTECPRTAANRAAFGCAGRKKSGPQQSLTTVLHVGTGLVWDWRRGPGTQAERPHLREMIPDLPQDTLLLADAGFTGYELLRELIDSGRSFVIRAGANVHLLKKMGYWAREYDGIVYLWPQAHREQPPLILRLVAVRDGDRTMSLLTNVLDETLLSDLEAVEMYRRRWTLEVFYRSFKRTMEKHKQRSASPHNAEVELDWSMVSLWMLSLLSAERLIARGVSPRRWSVAESLRVMRRILCDRKRTRARGGRRVDRPARRTAPGDAPGDGPGDGPGSTRLENASPSGDAPSAPPTPRAASPADVSPPDDVSAADVSPVADVSVADVSPVAAASADAVSRNPRRPPRRRRPRGRLSDLAWATQDDYRRRNPKAAHDYPRKKREKPPGDPVVRLATPEESQTAKALSAKINPD